MLFVGLRCTLCRILIEYTYNIVYSNYTTHSLPSQPLNFLIMKDLTNLNLSTCSTTNKTQNNIYKIFNENVKNENHMEFNEFHDTLKKLDLNINDKNVTSNKLWSKFKGNKNQSELIKLVKITDQQMKMIREAIKVLIFQDARPETDAKKGTH